MSYKGILDGIREHMTKDQVVAERGCSSPWGAFGRYYWHDAKARAGSPSLGATSPSSGL